MSSLQISEILQQLERNTGEFPRAAIDAAVASREEITPELLRILEDTVERAEEHLLEQFRESCAYPLVVSPAAIPGKLLRSLCGDFVTTDLGRVLTSVSGGEIGGIQELVEHEDADEWARSARQQV